MKHAIATLQAALEAATTNEPIHRNAGDIAQADLDSAVAGDCRAAIAQLSRANVITVGDPLPTVGRTVLYTLTFADAEAIKRQRSQTAAHGNGVEAGEVYPLVISRVWPESVYASGTSVNGQVILDGNDSLWVTSIEAGDKAGTWQWPPRV